VRETLDQPRGVGLLAATAIALSVRILEQGRAGPVIRDMTFGTMLVAPCQQPGQGRWGARQCGARAAGLGLGARFHGKLGGPGRD
jgi:hypothetical protein